MNFNSTIFIFLFLPAALAGYYIAGRKSAAAAKVILLALSLVFYGYVSRIYLLILLADMAVNYCAAGAVSNHRRKPLFVLAAAANVGLLLYFKYTNFFIGNINTALGTQLPLLRIILPIGVSFYTFSQISYLADVYTGEIRQASLLDYAVYITYFPKLIQGPTTQPGPFFEQLGREGARTFDCGRFVSGMQLFAIGLFKKVIIADTFAKMADYGYEYAILLFTPDLLLLALAFTMQIYFDFSGYSDMALGISRMFGIDLPVNFNMPYRSASVTEFWRRWHISLTEFFRKYIYIPLGGSKKGKIRTCVNIMIVFVISGLWHGADWTYILHGTVNGAAQVFEKVFKKPLSHVPVFLRRIGTFIFINFSMLLFGSRGIDQFLNVIMDTIFDNRWWVPINEEFGMMLRIPGLRAALQVLHIPYTNQMIIFLSMAVFFGIALVLCTRPSGEETKEYKASGLSLVLTLAALMISVIAMGRVSTFIYNNF